MLAQKNNKARGMLAQKNNKARGMLAQKNNKARGMLAQKNNKARGMLAQKNNKKFRPHITQKSVSNVDTERVAFNINAERVHPMWTRKGMRFIQCGRGNKCVNFNLLVYIFSIFPLKCLLF